MNPTPVINVGSLCMILTYALMVAVKVSFVRYSAKTARCKITAGIMMIGPLSGVIEIKPVGFVTSECRRSNDAAVAMTAGRSLAA